MVLKIDYVEFVFFSLKVKLRTKPQQTHLKFFFGLVSISESRHVRNIEVNMAQRQINSTIELNPELGNLAYEMGLNPSKICENALKLAIRRLQGLSVEKLLVDEAGFEPATSTMPTWRSYQADLLAHFLPGF